MTVDTEVSEDIFETIEEASRIIKRADDLRLFLNDTLRQSREAREVVRLASEWVKTIESGFNSYTPGEALLLADHYDLMHRLAFRLPADKGILDRIVLRAFDARIHGDKGVDEYILYKAVERRIWQHEKAFLDKPLTWLSLSLGEWHKQALKGFDHTELSDYDIISRVNILLNTDLTPFEGRNQQPFKQNLFNRHRSFLDHDDSADLLMTCALNDFRHLSTRFSSHPKDGQSGCIAN